MTVPLSQALDYANTWIDIIKNPKHPNKQKSEWIISESLHNFAEHFNK
ncbi:MAG: hypothetical protein WAW59_04710 [Patescibacteria group bacterium]